MHTLQKVLEKNPTLTLTVITTELGDMFATVKKYLTNIVVKQMLHLVPEWAIDGASTFTAALRAGHQQDLNEVPQSHNDLAFPQHTGGTVTIRHRQPSGHRVTDWILLAHFRQHLTGYKMPRIIAFRSEPLPKSNLGKFLRRELRDAAAGALMP